MSSAGSAGALRLKVTDKCSAKPLRACVQEAVEDYFRHLDGHDASGLFDLAIAEVEGALLESVLAHTKGNQSRAAAILGINRTTLRKKLKRHGIV